MAELRWRAQYKDGSELNQAPDVAYGDIDQSRLAAFLLLDVGETRLRIEFAPGERLVWRRRVEQSPGGIVRVCHIVGKRVPVTDGLEVSSVACIFEDTGELITADGFDENHPWLYSPQYLEHE
jgi:hypothetical protein